MYHVMFLAQSKHSVNSIYYSLPSLHLYKGGKELTEHYFPFQPIPGKAYFSLKIFDLVTGLFMATQRHDIPLKTIHFRDIQAVS